jgi:hypothetical protein
MVGVMLYMFGDKEMKRIPIIVSSCNKYRYLWDIQLQLFDKYWKECPHEIYYISETSQLPIFDSKLKLENINLNIETSGPSDWSYMMRMFLNNLESDYFIYMQEDYVLTDYVDQNRLDKLVKYVVDNDVNYVRFIASPGGNGDIILIDDDVSIREIEKGQQWRTSLMVAIWNKNVFLELINSDMNITPWQFEHINSNGFDNFYCLDIEEDGECDVIPFAGIYGSSNNFGIYPHIVNFLKNQNIKMLDGSSINYEIRL